MRAWAWKKYFFPDSGSITSWKYFFLIPQHSRGLLIPTTRMSKNSVELHLVAELEHQTDFLFFRSGSETAILGIEKYWFVVNAKNDLLNYQKWLLVLNKIILCDFRIKLLISSTSMDQKCGFRWKSDFWSKNGRGSPRNWMTMEIFVNMILVSHFITLYKIWATNGL